MQRAMWTAATGMHSQQVHVDAIAHNLANVNTNGFKKSRAEFEDVLYQTLTAPGSAASALTSNPTGIQIGLGSRPATVKRLYAQGDVKNTENPLDLVIEGNGFFRVLQADGSFAYTRDGSFVRNQDGQVVTAQGLLLDPPITIPPDSLTIGIARDGTVSVRQAGQEVESQVGQIELTGFINPSGLVALGGNLFGATDASGPAVNSTPGLDGLGATLQGFLEMSNVSIVTELVDLIAAQRAYEMNSRAIQAADDMLQQLNNLIR